MVFDQPGKGDRNIHFSVVAHPLGGTRKMSAVYVSYSVDRFFGNVGVKCSFSKEASTAHICVMEEGNAECGYRLPHIAISSYFCGFFFRNFSKLGFVSVASLHVTIFYHKSQIPSRIEAWCFDCQANIIAH
jgi:hypothetical protein